MYRKHVIYGSFLLYAFILMACNNPLIPIYFENTRTDKVNIEILKPALKNIPVQIRNIGFITGIPDVNFELPDDSIAESYFRQFNDKYAKAAVTMAGSLLNSSPRYDIEEIDIPDLKSVPVKNLEQYADTQVELDAFLICRQMSHSIELMIREDSNWFYTENGSYKRYIAVYLVNSLANWYMFDRNGNILIHDKTTHDDKYFGNEEYTPQESLNSLPYLYDILEYASSELSRKYVEKIAPTWMVTQREFYGTGSRAMRDARKMVFNNNWDDAIQIWENELNSTNPVTVKHASFNMILAYEINNDLEQALNQARDVFLRYNLDKARAYIKILEERIENEKILQNQLY